MSQIIIYPKEDTISIIFPLTECGFSVEEIAQKDVPENIPYLIIEDSQLPNDRTFRNAWQADFSNPDGYGISDAEWLNLHPPKEINNTVPPL